MGDSYKQALTGVTRDGKNEGSVDSSASQSLTVNSATSFDNSSFQITSFKLNGKNFFQWSRSVQIVIR
ncbi:hypothetical protein TorRG33x02_118910, partial [Trema orientale]